MVSDNSTVMPVMPMGNNGGFGLDGGSGWWVLLFLFAMMGGWGNGFGGGFGGDGVLPYMLNNQTQNDVSRGFADAGLSNQLTGIQSSITGGFASSEVADCNRAMNSMQTAYNNQIASMNQRFADSQALNGQLNGIQSQLANCCCDNKMLGLQTQNLILSENCADRQALSDGIRDVITNQTANTQRILDMMCQDKIDSKNEKILELQNQLNMANLSASQVAQTAQIIADNARQTTLIEQFLTPTTTTTGYAMGRV